MVTLRLRVIYGNIGKEGHIVTLGRRVIYGNTGGGSCGNTGEESYMVTLGWRVINANIEKGSHINILLGGMLMNSNGYSNLSFPPF